MLVAVANVHAIVRADVDAVRVAKAPVAPSGKEVAVGVEDEHRRILALVEVDAVARVHRDVAHLPERPAGGQDAPGAVDVVHEVAGADDEARGVAGARAADGLAHAAAITWSGRAG